jgi:hypothetical protein
MTLERLQGVVGEVIARVERRCYTEVNVRRTFCRRTAEEILRDGHIHYGTPCHDLTTVAAAALREAGYRPVPVLCRIKRLLQPVKFQCGLEVEDGADSYYVGFSVTTNRVARGRFVAARSRTDVLRADPAAAGAGAPLLAFFGIGSPAEVDRAIRGHDLERHLRSYRKTTRPGAYKSARARALRKSASSGAPEEGLIGPGRWA